MGVPDVNMSLSLTGSARTHLMEGYYEMSKKNLKAKAPVVTAKLTAGEVVWKASERYTQAEAQSAGDNARVITVGYLLRLSKVDPECTRRDSRRQGLTLSTAIHGFVWKACLDRSVALPDDTAKTEWEKAIKEIYELALMAYNEKAEESRKARADKKAEKGEKGEAKGTDAKGEAKGTDEGTDEADPPDPPEACIAVGIAQIIVAINRLPPDVRPVEARKVCSEIMSRFE